MYTLKCNGGIEIGGHHLTVMFYHHLLQTKHEATAVVSGSYREPSHVCSSQINYARLILDKGPENLGLVLHDMMNFYDLNLVKEGCALESISYMRFLFPAKF